MNDQTKPEYTIIRTSSPDYQRAEDGSWWMKVDRGSMLAVPIASPPDWIDQTKTPLGVTTTILREDYDKFRKPNPTHDN